MIQTKKLNLGEYIIVVAYDKETSYLLVTVQDEGEEVIEVMEISADEDEE